MTPDLAIVSIAIVLLTMAGLAAWEGIKQWRWERKQSEPERRLKTQCTETDICTECGECWHKHIYEPWRFSHTFTNTRY